MPILMTVHLPNRYGEADYLHNELSGESRVAHNRVQNVLKEQRKENGFGFHGGQDGGGRERVGVCQQRFEV